MTEAPQIFLWHHLKQLRLPTFQGEYAKQARLCEMALNDPERRIKAAKFTSTKSLDSFDFKIMLSLNKPLMIDLGVATTLTAGRISPPLARWARAKHISLWGSAWPHANEG